MMKDWIHIDSVPVNVAVVEPLGDPIHRKLALIFKRQIERAYPPPYGAMVKVVSNPHDFGDYIDIQLVFWIDFEEANEWAFKVDADENQALLDWDEQALEEIALLPVKPQVKPA